MKGGTVSPWPSWGSHLRCPKPSEVARLTGNRDSPTWGDQLERGRASPSCSGSAAATPPQSDAGPELPPPPQSLSQMPDLGDASLSTVIVVLSHSSRKRLKMDKMVQSEGPLLRPRLAGSAREQKGGGPFPPLDGQRPALPGKGQAQFSALAQQQKSVCKTAYD